MAQTDIKELFRRAFGYEPPENFSLERAPERLEYASSSLGGNYYDTDLYGREFFLPVKLDKYLLPFAVISIYCRKNIVSTQMPERQGSVIEQISVDNHIIGIKGILVNDDNTYPEKEIISLKNLFEKNESLTIQSVLTNIFLNGAFDHKVVLKSLTFPSNAGIENAKPYEMELEADMIFDLKNIV